jgi:hypothetical protein
LKVSSNVRRWRIAQAILHRPRAERISGSEVRPADDPGKA